MVDYMDLINGSDIDEYPLIPVSPVDIAKLKWLYHVTHYRYVQSINTFGLDQNQCSGSRTTEIDGIYFYAVEPTIDHYQLGCQKASRTTKDDFSIMFRVDVSKLNPNLFLIDMTDGYSRMLWGDCGNDFDQYIQHYGAIVYTGIVLRSDIELVGCHDCLKGLKPEKSLDVEACPADVQTMFKM